MTKEKMIEAIYEKIADKTLSEGCKIKFKRPGTFFHNMDYKGTLTGENKLVEFNYTSDAKYLDSKVKERLEIGEEGIIKTQNGYLLRVRHYQYYWIGGLDYRSISEDMIIGHPVMIGDVLDYERKNKIFLDDKTLYLWDFFKLPIEEQSIECIKYIYNLIK